MLVRVLALMGQGVYGGVVAHCGLACCGLMANTVTSILGLDGLVCVILVAFLVCVVLALGWPSAGPWSRCRWASCVWLMERWRWANGLLVLAGDVEMATGDLHGLVVRDLGMGLMALCG